MSFSGKFTTNLHSCLSERSNGGLLVLSQNGWYLCWPAYAPSLLRVLLRQASTVWITSESNRYCSMVSVLPIHLPGQRGVGVIPATLVGRERSPQRLFLTCCLPLAHAPLPSRLSQILPQGKRGSVASVGHRHPAALSSFYCTYHQLVITMTQPFQNLPHMAVVTMMGWSSFFAMYVRLAPYGCSNYDGLELLLCYVRLAPYGCSNYDGQELLLCYVRLAPYGCSNYDVPELLRC